MSIAAIAYVWENSQQKGNELLLMLAIADYANEHGRAWPGIGTLAKRVRVDPRTAQRCMKRVLASGELRINPGAGPKGCHMYQVVMVRDLPLFDDHQGDGKLPPGKMPGVTTDAKGGDTAVSPDPLGTVIKSGRGTHLPPDWKPTPELLAWASTTRPDLDLPQVVAMFADHWRAIPGARGVKLDWAATFRNWIRKERPALGARLSGPLPKVKTCARGAECLKPGPMQGYTRMPIGDVCDACRAAYMKHEWNGKHAGDVAQLDRQRSLA